MSRMFPFITDTWNPSVGECSYACRYCWARQLIKDRGLDLYSGVPRLAVDRLSLRFAAGRFVFVSDMVDLFGHLVPSGDIQSVLQAVKLSPRAKFLFLTKNPTRYLDFDFPSNVVLGATIESNVQHSVSNAPSPINRIESMISVASKKLVPCFVSVEPILSFSSSFTYFLRKIKPWAVAVGYDNYGHGLPEPSLEATQDLVKRLEQFTQVFQKTMREPFKTVAMGCTA